MKVQSLRHWHLRASILALLLVVTPLLPFITARAQDSSSQPPTNSADGETSAPLSQILRLEKIEVPGGAELITVHAKLSGLESEENDKWIPLVSILRDTLGDNNPEN